jgi:hypothetical protein
VTLTELVHELNAELKSSGKELTRKICFREIRKKVSGASKLTNLQLLFLTTIVSSKKEFHEKVFIEFLEDKLNNDY